MYAYANRFDPGQPPSNSAAGLRSNLFATQSIIPHKNKQNLKVLKCRRQYNLFLENYPAFKGLKLFQFLIGKLRWILPSKVSILIIWIIN